MRLYYIPACALSNRIRILTKGIMQSSISNYQSYSRLKELKPLNLPVLIYDNKVIYNGFLLFFHGNKKITPYFNLLQDWIDNQEIQYFEMQIDGNFFFNIYFPIVYEKIFAPVYGLTNNNEQRSKECFSFNNKRLKDFLTKQNNWFMENNWANLNRFTINDISLFSYLASLDYVGAIDWFNFFYLKCWYSRMKSKPELNFILNSYHSFMPEESYTNVDF